MSELPIRTEVATTYTVSCLPQGHRAFAHFHVQVIWRGGDRWAVMRGRNCLSRAGQWDYESSPSECSDEWTEDHRFTLSEALAAARLAAQRLEVNGITIAEMLAREEREVSEELPECPDCEGTGSGCGDEDCLCDCGTCGGSGVAADVDDGHDEEDW